MTARNYHREHSFSGSVLYDSNELFDDYERHLFTKVVEVAEKEGKHVELMVMPTTNVFDAIVQTAQRLESSKIVSGASNQLTHDEQGKSTGDAWERLAEPRPRLKLEVHSPDGKASEYWLGPHAPSLRPEDVDAIHRVWLDATADPELASLHHYHIVRVAVEDLRHSMHGNGREEVLEQLKSEIRREPEPAKTLLTGTTERATGSAEPSPENQSPPGKPGTPS
jgi:hypothetical protein